MGAILLKPVPATPAIPDIDARQFGTGLWQSGLISFADCQAFVGQGVIPQALQAVVNTLPDDDTGAPTPRKNAIILITGALSYQRANPLVDQLGAAEGWDSATMDAKWLAWGQL